MPEADNPVYRATETVTALERVCERQSCIHWKAVPEMVYAGDKLVFAVERNICFLAFEDNGMPCPADVNDDEDDRENNRHGQGCDEDGLLTFHRVQVSASARQGHSPYPPWQHQSRGRCR